MLTASGMAPGIAEAGYMDAGKLMGVGQAYEQQEGAKLQEDIERYYQEENAAKQALANYMSLVGGCQYGGETTRTTPIYSNQLGTGLGTLGALAGICNLFGFWGN